MRTLFRAGVCAAAFSAALFAGPVAHATAPGDNGTVKIHDASTGEELRRNEPHVCAFYLDAFGFDAGQQVDWHIVTMPPTGGAKGETVKSGALALDGSGHARTEDLSLPDGHYKLFWNFDGEHGAAKHKVFWTDCEESEGEGAPAPSASASASAPASDSESGASGGEEAAPSSSPSVQGGGGGDLAETGAGVPVGLVSGVAAALLAAGGWLVVRRRRAS